MLTFQAMDTLNKKTELSENIHIKVQHALLAAQVTIKWILHDADIEIQREMLKELDSLLQENERLREEIKNLNETICSWQSGW